MLVQFGLLPDDAPPRLIRYYNGGDDMPTAMLDLTHNLLFVNRDKYQLLLPIQQAEVLRTHQKIIH